MTDGESDRIVDWAADLLRAPHPRDTAGRAAVVRLVREQSATIIGTQQNGFPAPRIAAKGTSAVRTVARQMSALRLPWWVAVAAAGLAFAIGVGAGRSQVRMPATAAREDGAAPVIEFVFISPRAKNVALVGDFNGWDSKLTPMKRADGRTVWSVAVRLTPGVHGYAFVVDGATWVVDPQAPLAADSWFGERTSIVVVPGDQRS